MKPLRPEQVIPAELVEVVDPLHFWFVIGGQAVRCLCPYRPTRDVDFGVREVGSLNELLAALRASGTLEVTDQAVDTVHGRWNGIDLSIFVLEQIGRFTDGRRLSVEGILATKLHAIIDRGTRRDFLDLYVVLQSQRLGLVQGLTALRMVYDQQVNDALVLRALTYFEDADREAPLPGEGERDWHQVREFFLSRVGQLLLPPLEALAIQSERVDIAISSTG